MLKAWLYTAAMVLLIGKVAGTYDASWWLIASLVSFAVFGCALAKSYNEFVEKNY